MEKIKQFAPLAQVFIALCLLGYLVFYIASFIIGTNLYQQDELAWRKSATDIINKLITPQNGKQN